MTDEDIKKIVSALDKVFATKEDLGKMRDTLQKDFDSLRMSFSQK